MGCVIGRDEPMRYDDLLRAGTSPEYREATEEMIEKRSKPSEAGPAVDWSELIVMAPLWSCGPGVGDELLCRHCDVYASILCDAPAGDGKTCDAPLCRQHRFPIGRDLDLCPIHATEWDTKTGGSGVVVLERLR